MVQTTLPVHPFDPERFLGVISHVAHSSVDVLIPDSVDEATRSGLRSSAGEIGDFLLIECGQYAIFGRIVDVTMPRADSVLPENLDFDRYRVAKVELLNTIYVKDGEVSSGILRYPLVGEKAYSAHPGIVQLVVQSKNKSFESGEAALTITLAQLSHAEKVTELEFTPEALFGRHSAILGTTGGGKSWTIARIVEELAKHNAKVILFDASGEYNKLRNGVRHVHIGYDPEPLEESIEVALPYFHLRESDLFAIFKPSGESQAPKLRAAMKSLKLARVATSIAPDGTITKAHKPKMPFEDEYRRHIEVVENPNARFDIRWLTRQIEHECVHPHRSSLEPHIWGDYSGRDQALCTPLIARIDDMIRSKELSPIFDPKGKPSLLESIEDFLSNQHDRVLRISLEHLSYQHSTREIVANALGRQLLQLAREQRFKENPLLVILDEAHHFLNRTVEAETSEYPLDSFGLIAKEGRKYGLSICMATQRPRDIPESVLSQIGTLIVHRLINDYDLSVVERASGDADSTSLARIPNLAPGEAVILGVDFPIPIVVKVMQPDKKPTAAGPNYQHYWR